MYHYSALKGIKNGLRLYTVLAPKFLNNHTHKNEWMNQGGDSVKSVGEFGGEKETSSNSPRLQSSCPVPHCPSLYGKRSSITSSPSAASFWGHWLQMTICYSRIVCSGVPPDKEGNHSETPPQALTHTLKLLSSLINTRAAIYQTKELAQWLSGK